MLCLSIFFSLLLVIIIVGLLKKSVPVFQQQSFWSIISSDDWHPQQGKFGMLAFIMGSIWVTVISLIIAVPLSLLTAIFLVEYAGRRIRNIASSFIDILAGIPSVIFGVWGLLMIVPLISNYIAPKFHVTTAGYTILAASIVLAISILPVIINVLIEIFQTVSADLRNAALSLGATKWQMIKKVVLRKALPGIVAAVVLGLSRAFGETIAVLMVVGNVPKIPHSVFDAGYPLPALIANNYGELLSIPLYDSALMLSALVLLLIVIIFNIISRIIIDKLEKNVI